MSASPLSNPRVCLLTPGFPPDVGGVANASARLAQALWQAGQLACVLSLKPVQPQDWPFPVYALSPDAEPAGADLLRAHPWQLIHAYYPSQTAPLAIRLKQQTHRPLIFSFRGNDLDRDIWQASTRPAYLQQLAQADVFTGVTRELCRKARSLFPQTPVHFVPNAVNPSQFYPATEPVSLPGLPAGARVLGFVGEARLKKGFPLLLSAFAQLAEQLPTLWLVMAGSLRPGADQALFQVWCKQYPSAAQRVLHLPYVPQADLLQVYQALDCLVLPSYQEGMANAALEAMACGVCVLATEVGGFPDLIENGQQGLLIPPFDLHSLVQALRDILAQSGRCHELGQAGLQRVLQHFSPAQETAALQAAYALASDGLRHSLPDRV